MEFYKICEQIMYKMTQETYFTLTYKKNSKLGLQSVLFLTSLENNRCGIFQVANDFLDTAYDHDFIPDFDIFCSDCCRISLFPAATLDSKRSLELVIQGFIDKWMPITSPSVSFFSTKLLSFNTVFININQSHTEYSSIGCPLENCYQLKTSKCCQVGKQEEKLSFKISYTYFTPILDDDIKLKLK